MLGKKLSESMAEKAGACACGPEHGSAAAPVHNHAPGAVCPCCGPDKVPDTRTRGGRIALAVALAGGVLVLNSYVAELFFAGVIDPRAAEYSALLGALILSVPIWWSAVKDLLRGKVYMNELVALALLAAFAAHDYRTAGAVAFIMLISIMLEKRTAIGAESSIESLIRLTPRQARRVNAESGAEESLDVLELRVGDVIRIRPGENFGADGVIVSGSSTVNQATITGESLPADKAPGGEVFAGTQNLTGLVDVRVTRIGKDTTLGKVRDLIVAAESSRLPLMRMVDRYVGYYTPTILTLVALVWLFTHDLQRVIAVLVIACPCALVVATPSAVIAAIAAAARLGILIKDVTHLELAAKLKAVVFDKTGTLTEGNLEVAKLHPLPGVEPAELMQTAASAEAHSNHPAAQALRRLAEQVGITWEQPGDYQEVPGKGVAAVIGGETFRVGRATWLAELGISAPPPDAEAVAGMSVVFVARGTRTLGWIGLRDAVRPAAKEAIERLNALGVKQLYMVTGDNEAVAKQVAAKVGIEEVRAGCLPQEKAAFVSELRASGLCVAVVGDGVNDAPALAAGDVGIAMGAIGSDVAIHSASVALMNNDLRRVPFLIELARRTRRLMNQNLLLGLLVILGGLYLSTVGVLTPIAAAVLHSIGSLAVVFNSARLVRSGEELERTPPAGE